jgi:hypothetical protein
MALALGASAVVTLALLSDLLFGLASEWLSRYRARRRRVPDFSLDDPGRERRAEQKARELLKSCVSEDEWAMYRELGLIRVWGNQSGRGGREHAYLIYPHRPIVCYLPATGRLLHEYCVTFPDGTRPYGSERLPDSDDVLAKWMALTGDELGLLASANMHLVGHQLSTQQVARDIWRLSVWERARAGSKPLVPADR